MLFQKKTVSGKKKEPAAKERPRWLRASGELFRILGRILATAFSVFIITGCIVGCVLAVTILGMVQDKSEIDLTKLELNYTSIIYTKDEDTGVYVEDTKLYGDNGKRVWVNYEDIPDYVIDVTVAAEDKRFWEHQGVDFTRTLYATVKFLTGNTDGGGSTITQQLIKNVTGEDEVRIDRKVKEIFRAIALEKQYSKQQILEAYLNVVTFGYNTYGIQAAANMYFDKNVSELTVAEAAGLIAVTNNPSIYELFGHEEKNAERRCYIYSQMKEIGYIDEEEYETLCNTPLSTSRGQISSDESSGYQSWFIDYVIEEVISDLRDEYGWTYQHAEEELYNGGYQIYATVDNHVQDILEDFYENADSFPQMKNEVQPDSCFVILNYDGELVAMVGGRGEKTGSRLFNIVSDGRRHLGSAIKPISSYALAIERDLITYSTIVRDEAVHFAGEEGFTADWPVNYYGSYLGDVTVEYAVQRSINTIPVKLVELLTPRVVFDFLKDKLHVTTLVESGTNNDVAVAPMALGSLTDGVSPLEVVGAYQMIGNGGLYIEPHAYTEVLNSDDEVVLKANIAPERVISAETSTILNKLLQRVANGPNGTGTRASLNSVGYITAGKTGSASENTDLWFVGMTPYYLGATWMGYTEGMEEVRYSTYPTPIIWRDVMLKVHQGLDTNKDFPISNNVVSAAYCTETGDLATEYCPSTAIGWYKKDNMPGYCTEHYSGASASEDDEDDEDSSGSDRVITVEN